MERDRFEREGVERGGVEMESDERESSKKDENGDGLPGDGPPSVSTMGQQLLYLNRRVLRQINPPCVPPFFKGGVIQNQTVVLIVIVLDHVLLR